MLYVRRMEYVALDLETTGLDAERDRIIEFCLVRMDGDLRELERWTEMVNPGRTIPEEVIAIHGITDAEVADKPPFSDFAARVQEWVGERVLVAYNHPFDRDVLHYELQRAGQAGITMDHPFIDPFQIYRRNHPHTLEGAYRHYVGRPMPNAHRAEADTDAMIDVLRAQREAHALPADLREAVEVPERQWLDRARRIYRDDCGAVRFGFGKYRDSRLEEHEDYARWMLSADFPMDTKRAIGALLDSVEAARRAKREAASGRAPGRAPEPVLSSRDGASGQASPGSGAAAPPAASAAVGQGAAVKAPRDGVKRNA